MSDERAWYYCAICGRKIPVGEMRYGVKRNAALLFSGNTICKDCIAPENPVGRCGECENFGHEIYAGKHACEKIQLPYCNSDDFCSYFEPKGGEENG